MAEVEATPVVAEPVANDETQVEQSSNNEPAQTTDNMTTEPTAELTSEVVTEQQIASEPANPEQPAVEAEQTPASTEQTPAAQAPAEQSTEPSVIAEPASDESAKAEQSSDEPEAVAQSELVSQSEPVAQSEPVTESEPAAQTEPAADAEPATEQQPADVTSSIESQLEQPASNDSTKSQIMEEPKSFDEQSTSQTDSKPFEESKVESPVSGPVKTESVVDPKASLRQQLMDFVTYVIQYQPPDAFKQIESIIASLKSNKSINFSKIQSASTPSISNIVADDQERQTLLSYLKSLTDKPVKPVNPDDEDAEPEADPEPADVPEFVPHLLRDFSLFSQAGLAFSNDEYQMLDRAIINLAQQTEGLESVRFWGKMHALNGKDYYIAECKKSDYSAEEETDRTFNEKILNETGELVAERAEVWGAGANEFVYYVCQSIQQSINPWVPAKWVALPSVTPLQIKAARGSRRYLTGDLEAPVGGFPRFPGNESHYLRTQIARISHSTIIAPNGAWKEEEGGVVMENDEFKAHPVNEAVSWQHIRGHLRDEGRVEPFVDDEAEQNEEDASNQPKAPVEPLIPALRPTVDDSHSMGPRIWSYRANLAIDCGFQPSAKPAAAEDAEEEAPPASEPHCVYSAHSLLWPGAVNVVHGRTYASCYVGWGLKRDRNTAYRPPPPAPFQREYAQPMVEQTEPKPTEAEQEELKREAEEEAERKKEEGESKPAEEEEDDPLPDDAEEETPED